MKSFESDEACSPMHCLPQTGKNGLLNQRIDPVHGSTLHLGLEAEFKVFIDGLVR